MYDDLDYSAFANLNLRHFETESAEQRPPSLLPQTPALLPSSEQANHDFLGEDICTLRRSTCRGIVSKLRYSKYDKGQKRKYRKHLEGGEGSCRDCIARKMLVYSIVYSIIICASIYASIVICCHIPLESQHEQNNHTNRAFCPVRTCPRGAEPCHSNARNGRKDTGTDGGRVRQNVSHCPDSSARTNG